MNFSGALSTWKDINLSELQKTLDTQGVELVENQKSSVLGRKALADRTKEFKKIPDEEKVGAFKTLLKAYQTEIDSLTNRLKASDNAFLTVYKLLADAPDPYPLLEAAVDQTVKVAEAEALDAELRRLREENGELKRKVNESSSVEAAAKKAEARAEVLEEKMENMIQEKVTQKENELNATYDERMRNYEERERDLQRQLKLTKEQLRDLRTSNETNQAKLMNQSDRQDHEVIARLAEVEMLAADLERANERIAAVERRNELLRAEIESVRSGSESENRIKSLDANIAELESETARLLQALESQKENFSTAEQAGKKRVEDLLSKLESKDSEIDTLRGRLRQYSDYDEVKRELEILKYVEFAGAEYDEENDADVQMPDPNMARARDQGPAKSLEALVLAKNKRILDELAKFRILHAELEASLQAVTDDLTHTRAELDKQRSLNERLENDLVQINQHAPSSTNGTPRLGFDLVAPKPSASQDGLAGLLQDKPASKPSPPPYTASSDASILPIVTNQRDRFRQRNGELEEELRKQYEIISELRADIKGLQQDNLKLYEKVRYMQSYRDGNSALAGPSSSNVTFPPVPNTGQRADEMSKYKNMYEERMNPFEAFKGREQARAVQALNPVERGVFILTRAVLGNRRARLAFAFYAGALHLLVLLTLWESMHSSTPGGNAKVEFPYST